MFVDAAVISSIYTLEGNHCNSSMCSMSRATNFTEPTGTRSRGVLAVDDSACTC